MENTNPLEVDDILSRIAMVFSANSERNTIAETNRQFRDNIGINRATRAAAMMRGAMERYRLTKFPPVTSMDLKIREVVPPFWILATAMSNHATARDRREHASVHAGNRYEMLADSLTPNHFVPHHVANPDMNTPEYRRVQAEGYFHVQYMLNPDHTLRHYFQTIANKVNPNNPIDVTRFFDDTIEQTAPELLRMTFTRQELDSYGW